MASTGKAKANQGNEAVRYIDCSFEHWRSSSKKRVADHAEGISGSAISHYLSASSAIEFRSLLAVAIADIQDGQEGRLNSPTLKAGIPSKMMKMR